MAFNDMNSWDEDPDELLRRRWQQTFADFEVKPRPVVSRRILSQLSAERRRKSTRWLVAIVLLLLLSIGLGYRDQDARRAEPGRDLAMMNKSLLPSQPLSTRPSPPTEGQAERRLSLTRAMVAPASNKAVSNPSTTRRLATPLRRRTAPSFITRLPAGPTKLAQIDRSKPTATTAYVISPSHPSFATTQLSTNQVSVNTFRNDWRQLNSRGLRLSSGLKALPNQLPDMLADPQLALQGSIARQRWRWFVDVIPLSSFQWMSVPAASSGAYLSNVSAPAAFSPATWGYQLNGGVRFRHWLAYVATGQLRRWAYYTVNENRYQLVPTAEDPHHLVREVHTVAENVSMPLIGAGLSQQRLLAQGRYAVELGGQVSYLPTSGQPLIGLRGGATRRLLLNGRTELQVGLTAEYGMNHLISTQRQLFIHPLVLGFGLRIQPR